jgi:hypothetical protein
MKNFKPHIVAYCCLLATFQFWPVGQAQESKDGGVQFKFRCDSLNTLILAEATISIYILDAKKEVLISSDSYCTSKYFPLPAGVYAVVIESPKFCTEEIHELIIQPERLSFIELNLKREQDPDCTNEQHYQPPKTTTCG